ncbi:MAG: hypothetical protein ACLQF0_15920 [Dissulfurispiraceae bacterium]
MKGKERGKQMTIGEESSHKKQPQQKEKFVIPKGHVMTPGGLRHESRVHLVEPGHVIDGSGGRLKKLAPDGRLVKDFGPLAVRPGDQPLMPTNVSKPVRNVPGLGQGWVVDARWDPTSTVFAFKTTWTVPPAPATTSGVIWHPLIYIFNGIQSSPMILQPVLQWGDSPAGGGSSWEVASWYADGKDGDALHSNLVQVNTGDILTGVITLTGQTGSKYDYVCEFDGMPDTRLSITGVDELWQCVETLEAYCIDQASDYPTRKIPLNAIEIQLQGGVQAPLLWNALDEITDCSQEAVIVSNASPGGAVALYCFGCKQMAVGQNEDGRLEVFYTNNNDALYHLWQVAPNDEWSPDVPLARCDFAKQLSVGVNADGHLELFYVGTDDRLYHNWQVHPNGDWHGEEWLGVTDYSKKVVVGRNEDGRLEIFYIGTNDKLYHNWQTADGWHGESELGGAAKDLVVGRNQDGRLELFYVGTDDALYHNWQTAPNNDWIGQYSLGGFAKQIAVGQNQDGRLELFYIGTNDELYHNCQTAPNNGWSGEYSLGGLAKQIAVGQNQDGRLELFYIGTDDALYHNWQTAPNNGWSGEQRL